MPGQQTLDLFTFYAKKYNVLISQYFISCFISTSSVSGVFTSFICYIFTNKR